jgi:hypothetical protein
MKDRISFIQYCIFFLTTEEKKTSGEGGRPISDLQSFIASNELTSEFNKKIMKWLREFNNSYQ